ncbi:MAG: FAD-binding oxidoreductase [Deltaproteobacteria bacterium]|nr:FAD-binding oxidoreductase [Deltaproteobacteria bacterium]
MNATAQSAAQASYLSAPHAAETLRERLAQELPPEVMAGETLSYQRSTAPTSTTPAFVVWPETTTQVQCIIRHAARCGVPIYPISAGKNWGYGDACAPRDGCVLLDLSRMNRILEVNTELAYAVVEPGVTQGQLFETLERQNLPLWMDAVGAGPEASIVGNVLERGIGLGPYGDRFAHACGMEVVLPNGELLRTGLGAYEGAKARHLTKSAPGPQLDGLFTQGNFGVITRLTFWLMPKPQAFSAFFIRLHEDSAIEQLVEALRPLRLSGTLRCSVHAFSAMRVLGGFTRYPYHLASGEHALEREHPKLVASMLRRYRVPAWLAVGSLHGSRVEVRAAKKVLRRALAPVRSADVHFVSGKLAPWLRRAGRILERLGPLAKLGDPLNKIEAFVEFLQGRASTATLTGSHWRGRHEAPSNQDPLDTGSGMLWVSPLLPATAKDVREAQNIARACFHAHGFEYQTTLSQVSDRALCAIMSIQFDRESTNESARAQRCHDELVDALVSAGYVPYRGHPLTIARLHDKAKTHWALTRQIKDTLDPQETIAPGRYVPTRG